MKRFLPLLLLASVAGTALQAQTTASPQSATINVASTGFVLTGNIQGLPDGDVTITPIRSEEVVAKTASTGGVFVLKGSVPEPGLYWLKVGKEPARYIFLENVAYRVAGTKAAFKNLRIEGGKAQEEFALFEKTFNPHFANLNAIANEINSSNSDAKKAGLMPKYQAALAALQADVEKFIAPRSNSLVALFVLSATMQSNENIFDVERRFNSFSETVRSSTMGREVAGYITYAKVGAIGTDALDFTQPDVNDKPVTLSSFKGKYVLVDFWASWCRPCRIENPNVVKAFNKFKNKNFTVLGVSLDQQKGPWLDAIAKDRLTWTHVSDLQFWNNAVAQLYRVQSIPQNFLIDPNGKIVAKDLRGEDLEKKLCEYLGCTN